MKLKSQVITRKGDQVTIEALWHSKFKKPTGVKVTLNGVAEGGSAPSPFLTGDVVDVHGFLFGCAAIAWRLGWRPAGFMKAMNAWVADYDPNAPVNRP